MVPGFLVFLRRQQGVYSPLFIGLSVGIAVSLILTPLLDEECFQAIDVHLAGGRTLQSECVPSGVSADGDYEPVLQIQPNKPRDQQKHDAKTVVRPRFYSTELGIREKKLFVGVISEGSTVATLGVALNKTLAHHVDKLLLFADTSGNEEQRLPFVIKFSDQRPMLKPFHVIHYIGEHYLNDFDFYFIVPDTTYVRGAKLRRALSEISVGEDVYMGCWLNSEDLSTICDLDGGIVVGNSVMRSMVSRLNLCIRNAVTMDSSVNLGQCVLYSSNVHCQQVVQDQHFTSLKLSSDFNFDDILIRGSSNKALNASMSVYPVKDPDSFYKLHLYFSSVDLDETYSVIKYLQRNIVNTVTYLSSDLRKLSWPIGSSPSSSPSDRFDVVRWDYITESHVYLGSDLENYRRLHHLEKIDLQEVIDVSSQRVRHERHEQFEFRKLVNGFRRFDPNRGMDYILDIEFESYTSGKSFRKRFRGLRELGQMDLVPVPYVTENTRVVMLLPVGMDDREGAVKFLHDFAKVCLEKQDNIMLILILLYSPVSAAQKDKGDSYGALKNLISMYNNKYEVDGAKLSWTALRSNGYTPSDFAILDIVSKKLSPRTLFLMCTTGMELRMDYVNRVRMNTIANWQVFFPIPFAKYHPAIIDLQKDSWSTFTTKGVAGNKYKQTSQSGFVEIQKNTGHFDIHDLEHYSFYNSDYQKGRKMIQSEVPIFRREQDLKNEKPWERNHTILSMFLSMKAVHVLRAAEPSLQLNFKERICNSATVDKEAFRNCWLSRYESLASRSQLASLLLHGQQRDVDTSSDHNQDIGLMTR